MSGVRWCALFFPTLGLALGACPAADEPNQAPSGDDVAVPVDTRDVEVLAAAPACNNGTGPVAGPWIRCAGGPFGDLAFAVAAAPNGDVVVAGLATHGELRAGDTVVGPHMQWSSVLLRYDAAGRHLDSRAFGGTGDDVQVAGDDGANAVGVDASGDIIVAGTFTGRLDFGAGIVLDGEPSTLRNTNARRDIYVAKFEGDGDLGVAPCHWARHIAALGFDQVADLAIDRAGATYLTGNIGYAHFGPFESSGFLLAKITADGVEAFLAAQPALGAGMALALDSEDHPVVVGFAEKGKVIAGTTFPGSSSFIVRFTPEGAPEWARYVTGVPGPVTVYGVGATRDGKIVVGGIAGMGNGWQPGFGVDAGDGVFVPITATRTSFVITYGLDGRAESGVVLPSAGDLPPGRSFVVSPEGHVAAAARFRGDRWLDGVTMLHAGTEMQLSVAEFDRAGTLLWHGEVAAETSLATQPGMAFDLSGALLVAGFYPDRASLRATIPGAAPSENAIDPFDDDLSQDLWLWKVGPR